MKRNLLILSGLFILFSAFSAAAHPLGNFSVNQYSRLEVERERIKIRHVLDLAEIPTFQLKNEIDRDEDGIFSQAELNLYAERITPEHLANLSLTVNNQPAEILTQSKRITLQIGAGNLPTLRIEWNLASNFSNASSINQVKFENKNYIERIGWNEIVLSRVGSVNIFDSTAFGSGVTDELKAYPQENLEAPLAERAARFTFSAGSVPENARLLQNRDGHATATVQKDKFAELINGEITFPVMLFGLLLALGLVTLFASNYILPEKLIPFLSFVSGLLVLYIGLTMFKTRLFSALCWEKAGHHHQHGGEYVHDGHAHDHGEHHWHGDEFTHTHDGHTLSHLPPEEISWKSLLALGISGGLLPCPSALVLMLSAISLGRIGYGLVLTLAFSFGLAATLTSVGLIFLYVGKVFAGARLAENRVVKALPVASAFVIACLGAVICYNSVA